MPEDFDFGPLISFRKKYFEMGLIGFDSGEKVSYGNISHRFRNQEFFISGTQTGHLLNLEKDNFSLVLESDFSRNSIKSVGLLKPSSESLTHAAIYQALPGVSAIIRGHSSEIWKKNLNKIPTISEKIEYGTTEMALAVNKLLRQNKKNLNGIFLMGGHKDGVFAFGKNFKATLHCLLPYL